MAAQYVTSSEFINSPYGKDYHPGADSLFCDYEQVDEYLRYISSVIDSYCGRSFALTQYTDVFEGQGTAYAMLNVFPVYSIDTFTFDTVFYNSLYQINGYSGTPSGVISSDFFFFFKDGRIRMKRYLEPGKIYTVTYTAGYSLTPTAGKETIPFAIKQATLMLAHTSLQAIENGAVGNPDGGSITTFKFGKFMEQYADGSHKNVLSTSGIPQSIESLLKKFKAMRRV